MTIMYCCDGCQEGAPEACGYFNRRDLRVLPDGRWLCHLCLDEELEGGPRWGQLEPPPEYVPANAMDAATAAAMLI